MVLCFLFISCEDKSKPKRYESVVSSYPNGKPNDVYVMEGDILVGMRSYMSSGKLWIDYECDEWGTKNGRYLKYNLLNGFIEIEGTYMLNESKQSIKHGEWKEYDRNGRVIEEKTERYYRGTKLQ